jgi:acyl-CoA oxidase
MARAQFLLTEVGHGLDARNLETTVTLLPNGDFDLHTPNQNAAK